MNLSCSKTYEFRAPVDPEAANLSKPANNTQCLEIVLLKPKRFYLRFLP